MANTLFISVDNVLNDGVFSKNIDPQYITQAIEWAQDNFIQQILGTDLYNQIQTEAGTTPNTLTPANETLLNDYLIPALIQRAKYHASYWIWAKFSNKSVLTKGSDVGSPVDIGTVEVLKNQFAAQSIQMGNIAIKYLQYNQTDFPLYINANVETYKQRPVFQIGMLAGGLFLGNVRPKRGFQDAMGVGYSFTNYYGNYTNYPDWCCW